MASDVAELKKCLKRCADDDDACRQACYDAFEADGGDIDGGKVFTDASGETIVVTDGGKVFHAKL